MQAVYRYLAETGMFSASFLERVMNSNFFFSGTQSFYQAMRREHSLMAHELDYADCCLLYRACFKPDHTPKTFTADLFSLISNIQNQTDGTV